MSKPTGDASDLVEGGSQRDARREIATPPAVRLFDGFTGLVFGVSMVTLLTAMTLLIGMDVILRVFFDAPIRGMHDIVGLCLLMLFVLGLPHSWRASHHVRMDVIYGAVPFGLRRVVDVFGSLAAIAFGLLLANQALRYVPDLQRIGSSTVTLRIPYWPFAIAIFVSAVLFTLSVVIDLAMTTFGRRRTQET